MPRKTASTAPARPARSTKLDLAALGARVRSVYGPFNSRVLIEMSADQAAKLFPDGLAAAGTSATLDAATSDLASLRERAADLADSALGATLLQLAHELDHPYNSATSKAMCAKALLDVMEKIRELAPPAPTEDWLDGLNAQRDAEVARLAGP